MQTIDHESAVGTVNTLTWRITKLVLYLGISRYANMAHHVIVVGRWLTPGEWTSSSRDYDGGWVERWGLDGRMDPTPVEGHFPTESFAQEVQPPRPSNTVSDFPLSR